MKMEDERVRQGYDRMMGEFGLLVYYFLAAAFVVKTLVLGLEAKDCAVELAVLVAAPVWQAVRSRQLALSFYHAGREWRYWKRVGLAMAALGLLYGGWALAGHGEEAGDLMPLLGFIGLFSALRFLYLKAEKRRAGRLEKEFED